jgi:cytochrome c oxidase assembly factor CtaG
MMGADWAHFVGQMALLAALDARRRDRRNNEPVVTDLMPRRTHARRVIVPLLVGLPALMLAALIAPATALAHGGYVPNPPDLGTLVFGWSFDPLIWLPAIVALVLWKLGVSAANRAHPAHPVSRRRTAYWVAGVLVIVFALDSGFALYDTTLFSMHMIQHLLLTLIGPPLLLLAGPITLLLQASSPRTRQRWVLPFLHARVVRVISHPVVAWILFAVVMWGSHFSPLFDAALENDWAHRLEHALYVASALLFWWPVVGPDPSPWKLRPPVRVLYVGLQMPQSTFLAVAIFMATTPLYHHYATSGRTWGPTALADQQLAGGIMWVGGNLVFMVLVMLFVWVWMQDDERRAVGEDRRLEAERAAIREREVQLAARRAAEAPAGDHSTG